MDPITSEKVMPHIVNALNTLINANNWKAVEEAQRDLWTAIENAATLGDPSAIDMCQTFDVAYNLEF